MTQMYQMPRLTFWYEFASTYSYLSVMRIEEVAQAQGVELAWKPFLLGVIFRDQGWPMDSPFNWQKAKGEHMWRDMERLTAARDLAFVRPEPFPQSGLMPSRLVLAVQDDQPEAVAPLTRALFQASFTQNAQLSDMDTLRDSLTDCGLDQEHYLARLSDPTIKARLVANTDEAKATGIFGAPSFVTEPGEMFWGDDRLEQAVSWAAREI